MRKAYSYQRFSTPEQSKGTSLQRQTDLAKSYCLQHGLELVESYTDLGVSAFRGKNVDPETRLSAFLEDVRAKRVSAGSYLLVESLDRLSRNKARKALRVLEDVCELGVTVATLNDGKEYTEKSLNDDPMSLLMSLLIFIRANEESETKSKRGLKNWEFKRGKALSATLSKRVVGWVSVVTTAESKRSKPALIPERAEVVKQIFRDYLDGMGQASIAGKLNTDGVPCFGKATMWHKPYISKILTNPAVIGTYEAHTLESRKAGAGPVESVPNYYPSVVSVEDFERVQAMLQGHCRKGQRTEVRNLLSRLGKCPLCDGTMTRAYKGSKRGRGEYLLCVKAKNKAGCLYHLVKYADVENSLVEGLQKLKLSSLRFKGQGTLKKELANIRGSLESLERQKQNIVQAIAEGTKIESDELNITPDSTPISLIEAIRALDKMIEARKSDAERIERSVLLTQEATIKARFNKLKELVLASDVDRAGINAVLHELCSSVVVDYLAGKLRLNFRFGGVLALELPVCEESVKARASEVKAKITWQLEIPDYYEPDPLNPEDMNII